MLMKKSKMVMLAVLIVSSISCTRAIPVKLELPKEPSYYDHISNGIEVIQDDQGAVKHFIVNVKAMSKLAKNKALCREDNKTLRAIIQTTH